MAVIPVKGTDKEGTELDKDPRDRVPGAEEPEPGGPIDACRSSTIGKVELTKQAINTLWR